MWYHITKMTHAKKVFTFTPSVPKGVNAIYYEGDIPRICVSDTVFKCLRGVTGQTLLFASDITEYWDENPCVYYTEETPFMPPQFNDFRVNNEHWFTSPTKFYYLARVDIYKLFKYNIIVPTEDKELHFPKKCPSISKPTEQFLQTILFAKK